MNMQRKLFVRLIVYAGVAFYLGIIFFCPGNLLAAGNYAIIYHDDGKTRGAAPAATWHVAGEQAIVLANSAENPLERVGFEFAGWSLMPDAVWVDYRPGDRIDNIQSNYQLYPVWENNHGAGYEQQVRYSNRLADTGSAPAAVTYPRYSSVVVAGNTGNMVREGYQFCGWTLNMHGSSYDDLDYAAGATITSLRGDLQLYPLWLPVQYTVTYHDDDKSSGAAPAAQIVQSGQVLVVQDNVGELRRAGYELIGWSELAGGHSPDDVSYAFGKQISGLERDLRLYPVWDDNGGQLYWHTVAYAAPDADAGSPPELQRSLRYASLTLTANQGSEPLLRYGADFNGWSSQAGQNVAEYLPGQQITSLEKDLLLYAAWDDNEGQLYYQRVTYHADPKANGSAPAMTIAARHENVPLQDNIGEPPLTLPGYLFVGWREGAPAYERDEDDFLPGSCIDDIQADWDLYPVWDLYDDGYTHTITYLDTLAERGEAPPVATFQRFASAQLADNVGNLQRRGHEFAGWSREAGRTALGPDDYVPAAVIDSLEEDLRLHPVWNDNDGAGYWQQVSYYDHDGSLLQQDDYARYGTLTVMDYEPLRPGQRFVGWSVQSESNAVDDRVYLPGEQIVGLARDLQFYPVWDNNDGNYYQVSVRYHLNLPDNVELAAGETPAVRSHKQYEDVTLYNGQNLVIEGYRFVGWSRDGTKDGLVGDVVLQLAEDLELRAVWLPMADLSVQFHANGGLWNDATTLTLSLSYNGLLNAPVSTPSRDGYSFSGWYVEAEAINRWGFRQRLQKDLSLYAGWQDRSSNDNNSGNNSSVDGSGSAKVEEAALAVGAVVEAPSVPPHAALQFTDQHIRYLYGDQTDGLIRPDQALNRAEVSVLLFRLIADEDKNEPVTVSYRDVSYDDWYAQAVAYLTQYGVLSGYSAGLFAPYQAVTRAEFAKMLAPFLSKVTQTDNHFSDLQDEHWAAPYLLQATAQGLLEGFSDGTVRPQENITRAQAVTILNRLLGREQAPAQYPEWSHYYPDLAQDHWAYAAIMEASTGHIHQEMADGTEIWLQPL